MWGSHVAKFIFSNSAQRYWIPVIGHLCYSCITQVGSVMFWFTLNNSLDIRSIYIVHSNVMFLHYANTMCLARVGSNPILVTNVMFWFALNNSLDVRSIYIAHSNVMFLHYANSTPRVGWQCIVITTSQSLVGP